MRKCYVKSQDVWASTKKSIKKVCNAHNFNEPPHRGFTSAMGSPYDDIMPIKMFILLLPNIITFITCEMNTVLFELQLLFKCVRRFLRCKMKFNDFQDDNRQFLLDGLDYCTLNLWQWFSIELTKLLLTWRNGNHSTPLETWNEWVNTHNSMITRRCVGQVILRLKDSILCA